MSVKEPFDLAKPAAPEPLGAFLERAQAFLNSHAQARSAEQKLEWGDGDEAIIIFEETNRERDRLELERARKWQAAKMDAGFGWITGPVEHGGAGLTAYHDRAYRELEAKYDVPPLGDLYMGLNVVVPSILSFGTETQKRRYVRSIYRGDIIACQLFSEPGAGSDLASLSMSAVRDEHGWVLNGQKVWSSAAHHAHVGDAICRTGFDQPKHKGLTAFLVDLHSPGVEIRPLRQMTGGWAFNEVFFDDVRVPDEDRLGDVGQGWSVVMTCLATERATIRDGHVGDWAKHFERVLNMARHVGRTGDPLIRQELAALFVHDRVTYLLGLLMKDRAPAGDPGPQLSLTKLALAANHARRADLVGRLLGPAVVADNGSWGSYAWADLVLSAPALSIAGGTSEILRNVVGERVLGLPREPVERTSRQP